MKKETDMGLVFYLPKAIKTGAVVLALGFSSGCETSNYGLESAIGGAGIGAIIGNQNGHSGRGAIVGGLIGSIIGSQIEKQPRGYWEMDRNRQGRGVYRWVPGHYEAE